MHGQKDRLHPVRGPQHLARGIQTVQTRHGEIEDRDVGVGGLGQRHRLPSVGRLAHDLEPLVLEHRFQPLTYDLVVIREQDLDRHGVLPREW